MKNSRRKSFEKKSREDKSRDRGSNAGQMSDRMRKYLQIKRNKFFNKPAKNVEKYYGED